MVRILKTWIPRLIIIALLVYAGYKWGVPLYKQYMTPKKESAYIPTAKAKQGAFVVSFHELGSVQAERSVFVASTINGKIITLVKDGEIVKAGSPICTMDISDLKQQARSQRLNYENAKSNFDRAKADAELFKASNKTDMEQAVANLEFTKSELDRAQKSLEKKQRLATDKLIPKSEVEDAEFQVRSKQLDVKKQEMSLELKKKEIQSKEQQKDAEVQNVGFQSNMAKISFDEANQRLKESVLKAPAGGLVVLEKTWTSDGQRKLQPGDMLNPQQTVCQIPDLSSMQVKVAVGEGDAPKLIKGMKTRIKLEAVPNKRYTGKIKDISSLATEGRPWDTGSTPGKKTFEVVIQIDQVDPSTLKPGMTADVEFVSNEIAKATYVPIEAVFEREGKTWVFIKNGRKFTRTQVKTGLENDNYVIVSKGLGQGDAIALIDPSKPVESKTGSKTSGNGKNKKAAPMPNNKAR